MSDISSGNNSTDQRDALMELLAPDGYYTYLGLDKATATVASRLPDGPSHKAGDIDEEAVKKAYRKLSRKHHPDKGGDAETFKQLARAYRVLLNPKLRQQYDILGIDLDDDTIMTHAEDNGNANEQQQQHQQQHDESTAQGIVQEIASMALTGIIQLAVRTAMLGLVSVLLIRYRFTFYPMLLFLGYIALQIAGKASLRGGSLYEAYGNSTQMKDVLSPLSIAIGLIFMHSGRDESREWSWVFWLGETMVIALFTLNSIESIPRNVLGIGAVSVLSGLLALWFRGKFWNYSMVIAFEAFMAIFIALAFPVMEMVLEAVLNEKLKKVGEKIRAHRAQMEAYYANKK